MTNSIPTITFKFVTPDIARLYLTHNTSNRSPKKTKIAQYARDMASGRWLTTGEAIKFSSDGTLLDGQNRLFAVIESGATVPLMIARNVPSGAMRVLDSGSPRSTADVLTLSGHPNGKDLSAAVNVHSAWKSGVLPHAMSGEPSSSRFTHSEAIEYLIGRESLIESATFGTRARAWLPLPVGSLAVAYDAFVQIDPDDALDFFGRIRDMRTNGTGDPVATLLKRVQSDRLTRGRILPSTGLFYLFRAWNAMRAGESFGKFQIGSAMSGWTPIPEPK